MRMSCYETTNNFSICVCVFSVLFFGFLNNIKGEALFKQIYHTSVANLLLRSKQLNLSVCAHLCAACLCVCMHSNVCFNVLTYATRYKQCFMQTVAALPSDKAPEQEKETVL